MNRVTQWLKDLIEVFFPFSCHCCGRVTEWGIVLCGACREDAGQAIRSPREIFDVIPGLRIWTLSDYEGVISRVVKAVKYRPSKKLLREIAPLAKSVLSGADLKKLGDVLIPVPLSDKRRETRGFNQAEMLARAFAEGVGVPVSRAVIRSRDTRPQADCNVEERQSNLTGAFALAPGIVPATFSGKRLILVDDVATTGATLHECARPLADMRPERIIGLVLSHSPKVV